MTARRTRIGDYALYSLLDLGEGSFKSHEKNIKWQKPFSPHVYLPPRSVVRANFHDGLISLQEGIEHQSYGIIELIYRAKREHIARELKSLFFYTGRCNAGLECLSALCLIS